MINDLQLPATVSPNASGAASLQEFAVTVRRLSNAGISLSVDRDTDSELKVYKELMLNMSLPGNSQAYTIACIVLSRSELDDSVIYGCEYDWSATMDPLGVVEDLLEYTLNS